MTNGGSCYPEVVANSEAGSSLTSELLCRDDEWGLCVKTTDGFCQQSLHNLELIKLLAAVLLLLYAAFE